MIRLTAMRLFATVLLVSFCIASPGAAGGRTLESYRLGPGDRLKVTVSAHPRESGEFEVDGLGIMAYPPLGRIKAQGRTVAEMQGLLRAELAKSLINDPKVTVDILNFRPFYIYGEIKRAGSYPYVLGLTVRRAVAIAGGFTRRGRRSPVNLIREGRNGMEKSSEKLDVPVLPGDIIEVSRRLF